MPNTSNIRIHKLILFVFILTFGYRYMDGEKVHKIVFTVSGFILHDLHF